MKVLFVKATGYAGATRPSRSHLGVSSTEGPASGSGISSGGKILSLPRGWTLVELLVTAGIIAVLLSLVVSTGWKKMLHRAERAGCESNLKSLHGALTMYMADYGHWPQVPEEYFEGIGDEDQYMGWWFQELKPFQITEAQWMCPTDRRERNSSQKREDRGKHESSYGITPFGPGANEPRQFNTPWVVERADFHGKGPLMIMPEGTVQASPFVDF
ncbi:MAG: type II secretion system protein [Verrucomicrobiales bacterium]